MQMLPAIFSDLPFISALFGLVIWWPLLLLLKGYLCTPNNSQKAKPRQWIHKGTIQSSVVKEILTMPVKWEYWNTWATKKPSGLAGIYYCKSWLIEHWSVFFPSQLGVCWVGKLLRWWCTFQRWNAIQRHDKSYRTWLGWLKEGGWSL